MRLPLVVERDELAEHAADAVPALVQDAIDAADFIRTNVAQTVQNERGNFEFKPTPEHVHVGTEPPPLPPEHMIMGGGGSCGRAAGVGADQYTASPSAEHAERSRGTK